MIAAESGYIDMVKLLIELGANVNSKNKFGRTALMIAALNKHYDVVRLFIKHGADITIRDAYGVNALEWLKESESPNNQSIVELLTPHDEV